VFVVLNHLFNDLGYNPTKSIPGQHGYLWWLAWLDHNARTLFSVQDAASVFRPLFAQISCAQLENLLTAAPIAVPVLNFSPVQSICDTLGLGSAAKDKGTKTAAATPTAATTPTAAATPTAVTPGGKP
jgi:hypothetical protein